MLRINENIISVIKKFAKNPNIDIKSKRAFLWIKFRID